MAAFTKPVEKSGIFPKTDLTLVIEGQKLYVNKEVLAKHSPVFKTMFTSDFKEKTATKIELTGKTVEGFTEFLKCFYPSMRNEINEKNVLLILPIAHEYQSPLKERCEDFMSKQCRSELNEKSKMMSLYTLLDYVKAAETYDLPALLRNSVDLCAYVSNRNLRGIIGKPFVYSEYTVDSIASRYKMLTPEVRALIAEKRLDILEKSGRINPEHCLCMEPSKSFIQL